MAVHADEPAAALLMRCVRHDVEHRVKRTFPPQPVAIEAGGLHAHGAVITNDDFRCAIIIEVDELRGSDSGVGWALPGGIGGVELPRLVKHKDLLAAAVPAEPPASAGRINGRPQEADGGIGRHIEFVSGKFPAAWIEHDHGPPAVEGDDPAGTAIIEADHVSRHGHALGLPGPDELEAIRLPTRCDLLRRYPLHRTTPGDLLKQLAVVPEPGLEAIVEQRPGGRAGRHRGEDRGEIVGHLVVVAQEHVGNGARGREHHHGGEGRDLEGGRGDAPRVSQDGACSTPQCDFLAECVVWHIGLVNAHGEVLDRDYAGSRSTAGRSGRERFHRSDHLRHRPSAGVAAGVKKLEHDHRPSEALARHGRAVESGEHERRSRLADQGTRRLGRRWRLQPVHTGCTCGHLECEGLRRHRDRKRRLQKIDHDREPADRPALLREKLPVGRGGQRHPPQQL